MSHNSSIITTRAQRIREKDNGKIRTIREDKENIKNKLFKKVLRVTSGSRLLHKHHNLNRKLYRWVSLYYTHSKISKYCKKSSKMLNSKWTITVQVLKLKIRVKSGRRDEDRSTKTKNTLDNKNNGTSQLLMMWERTNIPSCLINK